MKLRKRTEINYYEPEEPSLDDYLYCDKCENLVYEYCSVHGPLLVVPDDHVSAKTGFPDYVPRAALTIPHVFLHIARSVIPGAGLGVFSTVTLPHGVRFGPYLGLDTTSVDSTYCWQLCNDKRIRTKVIDAADPNISNWMRYVNCSRHWREQNLVAYQYQGQIYYRTIKIIPPHTELLVFYGGQFARLLGIDLKHYNSEDHYPVQVTEIPKKIMHTENKDKEYFDETPHRMFEIENTALNVMTEECNEEVSEIKQIDYSINYRAKVNSPITVTYDRETRCFQIEFHNMFNTESNNAPATTNSNMGYIINEYSNDSSLGDSLASNISNNNDIKPSNPTENNNKNICHICGRVLSRKSKMKRHLATHNTNGIESIDIECEIIPNKSQSNNFNCGCHVCGRKFSSRYNLDHHLISHMAVNSEHVEQNSNIDLGNALYKCKICHRILSSRRSLTRHLLITHTKPGNLTTGEGSKNNGSYYNCSSCNYKTLLYEKLRHHNLTEHLDKYKKCHVCNKMITRKWFSKHFNRAHDQVSN